MQALPLDQFLSQCQERINQFLSTALTTANNHHLSGDGTHSNAPLLTKAIAYSLLDGGKRIRPALAYAAALAVNGDGNLFDHHPAPDHVAAAVEMIHAYSLIHDDLPAMDDDDLRRGKPTCHIAFDEATAILAGDGLQALAFETLTNTPQLSPADILKLVNLLARAAGIHGMVKGQAIDIAAVNQPLNLSQLEAMHRAKTGAMINASILMGAISANTDTTQVSAAQLTALETYGNAIGLAFQIQDDILDVTASTETLGKAQGADQALQKPTYTSLMGLEQAKKAADEQYQQAIDALSIFDHKADPLRAIAKYIVTRGY